MDNSQIKINTVKTPQNRKKRFAKTLLGIIFLLSVAGLATLGWNVGWTLYNVSSSTEKINGNKFIKPDAYVNQDKALKLSDELTQKIANNSKIEKRTSYETSWFAETQESNQKLIDSLLEQLAAELGSSETLGLLKTIKENKQAIKTAGELTQSQDPHIVNESKEKVRNMKMEMQILTAKLQQSYEKDGFKLTQEQVNSLIYSPHGEETASIINCFQNIKAICFVMENKLRDYPSHEMARKYYGAYYAMLLALDKIQKNTISKIHLVYIPEATEVKTEARNASVIAQDLLTRSVNTRNLSFNQQEALRFNIESCNKTERRAQETSNKLLESARSIEQSNEKLKYSIATAENSHTAMWLHTEIERIGQAHIEDLQKLEQITLPDMIAADFSDPDDPWLSAPKTGDTR